MSDTRSKGRIKNLPRIPFINAQFHFGTMSALVLGVFVAAAIITRITIGAGFAQFHLMALIGSMVLTGLFLAIVPMWPAVIIATISLWSGLSFLFGSDIVLTGSILSAGVILSPSVQLVEHWDKIVVLRLGRFHKVKGPGLSFIFPLMDSVASFVDTRIRVTDFSAERSITKDTVPVHVDALAFWMIWDPQKAVLEVADYLEAVTLSAQTALRDSVGKYELSTILSERERLGSEIQEILDRKTSPWGITILSVEFTEILIPKELEDALSKQAQAERERQSRVILGGAEVEIAKKFQEAAKDYQNNPTAMQLRAMNMIYEGIRVHGGMVVVPSGALEGMSLGGTAGLVALQKMQEQAKASDAGGGPESSEPSGNHSSI